MNKTPVNYRTQSDARVNVSGYASITVMSEGTANVLAVIAFPSEVRKRENGTVTIYSRKHPSTSVYGISTNHRVFIAVPRDGVDSINALDL